MGLYPIEEIQTTTIVNKKAFKRAKLPIKKKTQELKNIYSQVAKEIKEDKVIARQLFS